MTADLKPYARMKDSGVEWLGEVPEHWNVLRGKQILRSIDIRSTSGEEELLTVSSERGVVPRASATVTMFKAESYIGHKLCWPGDLVINSLWAWARGLGVSRHHGIISSAYGVYRLRHPYSDYSAFIHELVRSTPFHFELQVRSKGIWISRLQLTDEAFLGAKFPVPPSQDREAIVRFLNESARSIRRYNRAKQKLISLLEEQKQAVIHQAVTGQIDVQTGKPYAAYRDSGVVWLGQVPKHWGVSRIKSEFDCLNHRRRPLNSTDRGEMTSRRYDYYGASGVIDKVDDYLFDDELLLVAEDGANLVLRNLPLAIVARGKFWVNNHAHILKPRRGNIEFLAGAMERINYMPWISGAAQPKLTKDRLMNIAIAIPSRKEQDRIIGSISAKTIRMQLSIDQARREMDLLHEYLARLIADVVTGKLDVREAAARLPDEIEEKESSAESDTSVEIEAEATDDLVAVA